MKMIIIYDMDALLKNNNLAKAVACVNFKKLIERVKNIDMEDPSFVLSIVRQSTDGSNLTVDSTAMSVFNKFDEMLLLGIGVDIHKIPTIKLFTERLGTKEVRASMEVKFIDKRLSSKFTIGDSDWENTYGEVIFDTTQYVLLCEVEMDQRFNKINDGKMTILYDIDFMETDNVSIIENENFNNLLEKAGIDGGEIKHVTFKRITHNRTTSPSLLDKIYENLEDLMLYNLGIDIDFIGNTKRETKQTFHKNIPVIQVRFHGKQLVYVFDPTTFDWVKRDDTLSLIDDEIN